jgi:hypothetical protein
MTRQSLYFIDSCAAEWHVVDYTLTLGRRMAVPIGSHEAYHRVFSPASGNSHDPVRYLFAHGDSRIATSEALLQQLAACFEAEFATSAGVA